MPRVVNVSLELYDVYIGRAGHGFDGYYGNPIRIKEPCPVCRKTHLTPGTTLPCFEILFNRRIESDPEFRQRIEALDGKVLGCFCKRAGEKGQKRPCHGDVYVRYLEKRRSKV